MKHLSFQLISKYLDKFMYETQTQLNTSSALVFDILPSNTKHLLHTLNRIQLPIYLIKS